MPDPVDSAPSSEGRPGFGAAILTMSGLAAAFGLASCCALPLLLATFGFGTAWLSAVALIAEPHRASLMIVAAACLVGGAVLLRRRQRAAAACSRNGACGSRAAGTATLIGLAVGLGLLWAGYTYA